MTFSLLFAIFDCQVLLRIPVSDIGIVPSTLSFSADILLSWCEWTTVGEIRLCLNRRLCLKEAKVMNAHILPLRRYFKL